MIVPAECALWQHWGSRLICPGSSVWCAQCRVLPGLYMHNRSLAALMWGQNTLPHKQACWHAPSASLPCPTAWKKLLYPKNIPRSTQVVHLTSRLHLQPAAPALADCTCRTKCVDSLKTGIWVRIVAWSVRISWKYHWGRDRRSRASQSQSLHQNITAHNSDQLFPGQSHLALKLIFVALFIFAVIRQKGRSSGVHVLGRRPCLTSDSVGQGQLFSSCSHSLKYFVPHMLKGREQVWHPPPGSYSWTE